MAKIALRAPSTGLAPLQIARLPRFAEFPDAFERWLEAERDQLFLWLPVALGAGIALWFVLPDPRSWSVALLLLCAPAMGAVAVARGGRASRVVMLGATAAAIGLALIWLRAEQVRAPVLARPMIAQLIGRVDRIDPIPARALVRLRIVPIKLTTQSYAPPPATWPAVVRINLGEGDVPVGLSLGAVVRLRARLMPPPSPAVPGAYDFARVAWFDRIGAIGRGLGPVELVREGQGASGGLRMRLSGHIRAQLPGGAGGIAAALATGDQGGIPLEDAEAMRRAGLAHLLSVSGLHITAVVGGMIFLVARMLALSPWLALHVRIPVIAAGAGALAAIGYTILTGAEVPTVRSCLAALIVLIAVALGREAITLRLVATGAIIVLLLWPEALFGPSFQLSFAAVAAIVSFHEAGAVRTFFARRDEQWFRTLGRQLLSLLATGLLVEVALAPIALFHFHRAGLYGAFANIIAIPLTTFVIMPIEAMALVFDLVGLGAPLWWLAGQPLGGLLWLARTIAAAPGAVAMLPSMSALIFSLFVLGGIWLALLRTKWRLLGTLPIIVATLGGVMTSTPDVLVTGDGRHLAVRAPAGGIAILRDRTGDYVRDMLAENSGVDEAPTLLSDLPQSRCNRDACIITVRRTDGREWRLLATRSPYLMPTSALSNACKNVDIVVSDRRLPRSCKPRWLRLDRPVLARTGGVAITLSAGEVRTVYEPGDQHPWRNGPKTAVNRSDAATRRAFPAHAPAADHNAEDHKRGLPDQAAPSRLPGENT